MSSSDLEKLHKALLIIMDEIDRICKLSNIRYSLFAGSMLGAVRHGGFIPWDDDMDVAMLRNDYEKFIDVCKTQLDPRFKLLCNREDEHYVYGFSKIILNGTSLIEHGLENVKYQQSIFIDVFTFDIIPQNKNKQRIHQKQIYFYSKLLQQKQDIRLDKRNRKKFYAFIMLKNMARMINKEYLVNKLDNTMRKYNKYNGTYVSNMVGYYGYFKEIVPKKMFEQFEEIIFENRKYSICSDYHIFLSTYYGDYMTLPPEEQRRCHGFSKLDFGEYDYL